MIEYQLTVEDVRRALKLFMSAKRSWRILKALAGVATGIAVTLWLVLFFKFRYESAANINPLVIMFGFLWVYLMSAPHLFGRKRLRETPGLQGPMKLSFSEEGVQFDSDTFTCQSKWGNYVGWTDSVDLFLLYPNPLSFYPIPKRAFDPEQLKTFATILATRVKRIS